MDFFCTNGLFHALYFQGGAAFNCDINVQKWFCSGGALREGYRVQKWPRNPMMALMSEYLFADLSSDGPARIDVSFSFKLFFEGYTWLTN